MPLLEQNLIDVLREHTAGDPMRVEVRWTNLSLKEMGRRLAEKGTPAGKRVLRQLLKKLGFVKRKAHKTLAMGSHPDRDAQFQNIAKLKQEFLDAGQPVLSIDTKKKEHLGTFYRDGKLYSRDEIRVYDHDFPSSATGVVIPYGIYDLAANKAHVTLGTSHDTSEFACECLAQWWAEHGREQYPKATKLLILCDGGGSNASNRHVFKEELQRLADRLGLEIRVAHYPPYCSKYNPIEHRVFPHVTRACQGVVFETVELVSDLISRARTQTGLSVTTSILDRVFETGRKVAANFHETCRILRDELLPKWNYRAIPIPPS
jgi:DDE family transposase